MEKPNIFSFDICFLNDIAVANSGLLREYSLVDPRVRKLMMAVKLWAKEHQINSARNGSISSYAWINLVIFYLQCIRFVPNLQCTKLMKKVSFVANPQANAFHSEKKLDTCYVTWEQVKSKDAWSQDLELSEASVSALLYGFFEFYSRRFPGGSFSVSIKKGGVSLSKVASNKARLFLSIEDPFETYDSDCPHDLGMPADESGTRDLMEHFHIAESQLREILLNTCEMGQLWPDLVIEPETPAVNARNTLNGCNPKEGRGRGGRRPKANIIHDQSQAVSEKTMGDPAAMQEQHQQLTKTSTSGPATKKNGRRHKNRKDTTKVG